MKIGVLMLKAMKYAAVIGMALVLGAGGQALAQKSKKDYREHKIVIYGDSFTAGYGLSEEDAYPLVARSIINQQFNHDRIEVVNAGVVGDTAATGLARLSSILLEKPTVVVLAFGPNDALHGVDPNIIYNALDQMLQTLTYNNIYVMLVGMKAPDSANIEYAARFNSMYPELVKRYKVAFIPDLLAGVQGDWTKLQFDGIHPNEEGMKVIAQTLAPSLIKMVRNVNESRFQYRMR